MTQEIIYTSAPSGLKPGSRGFCTVVATRGLAKPLADQLEDLSGYRHIFLSNDANSALNPIVFSHLKLGVAGRAYHVLSRVCDAGLDYTQRTNKLAHHVTLEPRELTPSGPAALLSAPGFMTTSWSGEPTIREAGPVPSRVDAAPGVCREWGHLTGDPGWGGYIAEALVAEARKQIVLVYRPGTNVLALVAETLALLPANRRWDVTFCTYFTKLPPTVDCRWRCVVDGTPEAETLARSPTAIVVDLRKPLVPPTGSPYVSAARTGIPMPLPSAQPLPTPTSGAAAQRDQDDLLLAALGATPADDSINLQRRSDPRILEPSHSAQAYGLAPPPVAHDAGRRSDGLQLGSTKRARSRSLRPVVLLSTAIVGLLAIGGLGTYLYSIIVSSPREVAESSATPPESQSGNSERTTTIEVNPLVTPLSSATATATTSATPPGPPAPSASENTVTPPQVAPTAEAMQSVAANPAPKTQDPTPQPAVKPEDKPIDKPKTEVVSSSPTASTTPTPAPQADASSSVANSASTGMSEHPEPSSVTLPEKNHPSVRWRNEYCAIGKTAIADRYELSIAFASTDMGSGRTISCRRKGELPNEFQVTQERDKFHQTLAEFAIKDGEILYRPFAALAGGKLFLSSSVLTVTAKDNPPSTVLYLMKPTSIRSPSLNTLLENPVSIHTASEIPLGLKADVSRFEISNGVRSFKGPAGQVPIPVSIDVKDGVQLQIDFVFQCHSTNNAITLSGSISPASFQRFHPYAPKMFRSHSLSAFHTFKMEAEGQLKAAKLDVESASNAKEKTTRINKKNAIEGDLAILKDICTICSDIQSPSSKYAVNFTVLMKINAHSVPILDSNPLLK